MILTLSWLKNHLNTKASINEVVDKLTNIVHLKSATAIMNVKKKINLI